MKIPVYAASRTHTLLPVPLLAALLFSSSAMTEDLSTDTSDQSAQTQNLVDVFSTADSADVHISKLRKTASDSQGAAKRAALISLARALEYREARYPTPVTAESAALREALQAYRAAALDEMNAGRIRYTNKVRDLTITLNDKTQFHEFFDGALSKAQISNNGRYVVHLDYAVGLVAFNRGVLSADAEKYFYSAVSLRSPRNGYEAYYRLSVLLIDQGRATEAIALLDRFSSEERWLNPNIALLRQRAYHQAGFDTSEVDSEVMEIRKTWSNAAGVGGVPNYQPKATSIPLSYLELQGAHAAPIGEAGLEGRAEMSVDLFTAPLVAASGGLGARLDN